MILTGDGVGKMSLAVWQLKNIRDGANESPSETYTFDNYMKATLERRTLLKALERVQKAADALLAEMDRLRIEASKVATENSMSEESKRVEALRQALADTGLGSD